MDYKKIDDFILRLVEESTPERLEHGENPGGEAGVMELY
jgi:hypothetical protein